VVAARVDTVLGGGAAVTRAPANLLAVRRLLLDHLDDAPGPDDLEPAEVGIVGDPAHRGGYHCGSDRVDSDDYSVDESPRDRAGLTLDASALDVGWFEVRVNGVTHNLYTFNRWIVGELERKAPDSLDIREWIYTLDGKTVRRWDRLKRRRSGDKSHLWHSHGSWFRDAIKANRDQTPLFRRYLDTIGILEDELSADDVFKYPIPNDVLDGKPVAFATFVRSFNNSLTRLEAGVRESLKTSQAALAAAQGVDDDGIKSMIRESTAAEIERDQAAAQRDAQAAAERAELAELVRRVDAGELAADEVVRLIGERLTANPAATHS